MMNYVNDILGILNNNNLKKIISNQSNLEIEEKKGIGNIVTRVDKEVERYISINLKKMYPDSQIIAEESAEKIVEKDGGLKFIIDPLDGSTNFSNGWPYSIAIGVVDNNELVAGVIYDILQEKIYSATKGKGVCVTANGKTTKITKPQYLKSTIKKSVIAHDTPYGEDAFEKTLKMYSALVKKGASTKTVGPISLDVLKTALGEENRPHDYTDAVWHMEVRAWDLCAATAILRELGGEIIGKDGKPLSINVLTSPTSKICFIASGNKTLIEELYSVIVQYL